MSRLNTPPGHLYRIRYKREGWKDYHYRYRFDLAAARTFARRLTAGTRHGNWAPLTSIEIHRVDLADRWERVSFLDDQGALW